MFLGIISPSSSCSSYSWNKWSVRHFCFHNQNNSTSSPGLLGNGALTCSGLHFWRHFLVKPKILPNLVISNWLWWIMRVLLAHQLPPADVLLVVFRHHQDFDSIVSLHGRLFSLISHSRKYTGNGYKHSAQRLLGSFGWTNVTLLWLGNGGLAYHPPIVTTACPPNQSQNSDYTQILYSSSLESLKWRYNKVALFLL